MTVVAAVASTAEAMMVALLFPSGKLSFTAVMSKGAEAEPMGIVTEAGTVASVRSLEERFTTSALVVAPVRVTVPTEAGLAAFSGKLEFVALRESVTDRGATAKPLKPGEPIVAAFGEACAKQPRFPTLAAV